MAICNEQERLQRYIVKKQCVGHRADRCCRNAIPCEDCGRLLCYSCMGYRPHLCGSCTIGVMFEGKWKERKAQCWEEEPDQADYFRK